MQIINYVEQEIGNIIFELSNKSKKDIHDELSNLLKSIHIESQKPPKDPNNIESLEIKKVSSRLKLWAKPQRQNQKNVQILNAFLKLKDKNEVVLVEELQNYLKMESRSFEPNLLQMKIISDKNHGKVFEVFGNKIEIWEPVKEFVKKYQENIE